MIKLSDEEEIPLAVEAKLIKNIAQDGTAYNFNVKSYPLLANPMLVRASNNIIQTNHSNKASGCSLLFCAFPNVSAKLILPRQYSTFQMTFGFNHMIGDFNHSWHHPR